MQLVIRPFTVNDYEAIARLFNAAYADAAGQPLLPLAADDLREEDTERDVQVRFGRWVAEMDDVVVGVAEHTQTMYRYHPQKFWLDVYVAPIRQQQGVGSALYEYLLAQLVQYDPLMARCVMREDMPAGVGFVQRRGWREAMRTWESFLDLASFDPLPFAGRVTKVEQQGIVIKTLRELADDPARNHKLYELSWEIRQDLPDIDAATKQPFAEFVAQWIEDDDILPDAYLVALDGDQYVGHSLHTPWGHDPHTLRVGQTGVARAYRGRNIAWALKLRGVAYAHAHDYTSMRTTNEAGNRAVLRINEQLGFVKRPAWVDFTKVFKEG